MLLCRPVARSQWAGLFVSIAVAITATGFGGGSEPSGTYKSADVDRLVEIAPVTPGWPRWPQKHKREQVPTKSQLKELAARDPIFAAYQRRTAKIERSRSWSLGSKWEDTSKLAHLAVEVLDTSTDAHVVFAANNASSRAYGEYGIVDKAAKVDGLGDEAWRLWVHWHDSRDGKRDSEVTYHWRRDNLVFEVVIKCYSDDCPRTSDAAVDAAARAWVDAVDEQARSEHG